MNNGDEIEEKYMSRISNDDDCVKWMSEEISIYE